TYKIVTVYVDKNDNLIAIPSGESEKYGIKELDITFQLTSPYSDEELEICLMSALNKSYSQKADDSSISSIEKTLNVKGFEKAVRNRKVVLFEWLEDEGYFVTPTNKLPRRGFVHVEDKKAGLGKVILEG